MCVCLCVCVRARVRACVLARACVFVSPLIPILNTPTLVGYASADGATCLGPPPPPSPLSSGTVLPPQSRGSKTGPCCCRPASGRRRRGHGSHSSRHQRRSNAYCRRGRFWQSRVSGPRHRRGLRSKDRLDRTLRLLVCSSCPTCRNLPRYDLDHVCATQESASCGVRLQV